MASNENRDLPPTGLKECEKTAEVPVAKKDILCPSSSSSAAEVARKKHSEYKRNWRHSRSLEQKISMRHQDKLRKRRARELMSQEKKKEEREKDAKRKALKRQKEKETSSNAGVQKKMSISRLIN